MLLDRDHELLSAYVDGELGPRRRREVRRLLAESSEARKILRHMQEDARRLGALPPKRLGPDFAKTVLFAIENLPREGSRPAATLPPWASLSAAATILLAVGAAAFCYFLSTREAPGEGGQQLVTTPPSARSVDPEGSAPIQPTPDHKQPPQSGGSEQKAPSSGDLVQTAPPATSGPASPVGPGNLDKVFGDSGKVNDVLDQPKEYQVGVSIFRLLDMKKAQVVGQFSKDQGVHLDLPCKNGARACERLLAVLKTMKITPLVEQVALHRMHDPRLSTDFVIYLEDVTPTELYAVLEQLRVDDQKTRKGEDQFDSLILSSINDADRKTLARLLGPYAELLSWIKWVPPQGEPMKPADQQALVLPMSHAPQTPSPEVKRFLDGRKQPRARDVAGVVRAARHQRLAIRLRLILNCRFLGALDRDDLKIHQVVPVRDPLLE